MNLLGTCGRRGLVWSVGGVTTRDVILVGRGVGGRHFGRNLGRHVSLLWFKGNITARATLSSPVLDRGILTKNLLISIV